MDKDLDPCGCPVWAWCNGRHAEYNITNPKQEGTNMRKQAKVSLENATERPWRYTSSVHHDSIFIRSGEKVVCDVWEENEANAALIVRAVNSHDALVGLVEDLREYFADCADASAEGDPLEFKPNKEMTILEEIEAVLKLAKGE